jgi:hypothetical protein
LLAVWRCIICNIERGIAIVVAQCKFGITQHALWHRARLLAVIGPAVGGGVNLGLFDLHDMGGNLIGARCQLLCTGQR